MVGALGVTVGVMEADTLGPMVVGTMAPASESLGAGATMGGRTVASSFLQAGSNSGLTTRAVLGFKFPAVTLGVVRQGNSEPLT